MALAPTYVPPQGLRTALEDFTDHINNAYGTQLKSYHDLHNFSVTRLNEFWMSTWGYFGVKASVHPSQIINESIPIDQFPVFCHDARLNFAENMLRGDEDKLAVIEMDEERLRNPRRYTWKELRKLVTTYASALRFQGIKKGDVAVVVGSNCVRTLALHLATASVGAIFASFATDLGEKALGDRLGQLEPRFLFAESSYLYNGKRIDILKKIEMATSRISSDWNGTLVIVGALDGMGRKCVKFDDFVSHAAVLPLTFEQVPFNTPLVIMFSSGTTGTPKGIVHSHGGVTLNGWKEQLLHHDFGPEDVHFHFTNADSKLIGWTLWNITIEPLLCKAAIVLYDGSPFFPSPPKFIRAVLEAGVTTFGAGPRYYSELQKWNVKPEQYSNKLRTILSTGAVLTPSLAVWLRAAFGPVCQVSMSGGTELCGAFLHGTQALPSYPGEIAVKALGMDVVAMSRGGDVLPDGESGELVCRKPFPNMPVMFWKDPGRKRYHNTYFETIPHVWTHGDFIKVNPQTKGIYVLGRSDGTLNPSGVRFGSSDIYNILSTPQFNKVVVDAVVVGQQRGAPYSDFTERVLLFLKCRGNASSDNLLPPKELDTRIRAQIAKDFSRRHVPEHIFEVNEIPYNVNGKKMEIQVKAVVNGGRSARLKQRVSQQELAMLDQFEPFYHLEQLLSKTDKREIKL